MKYWRKGSYKNLIVWRKSMDLVCEMYKLTQVFPKTEIYGLSSQLKRASVSIASNIAEGSYRSTLKDFKRFLTIAFSSGGEVETQIEIAKRLNFINNNNSQKVDSTLSEIMKMLSKILDSYGE